MKIQTLNGAGQGKYIVLNSGLNLYDNINKYHGLRYAIEKFILRTSWQFRSAKSLVSSKITSEISHIENVLGPIEIGFLLDTSWYKDTFFIGSLKIKDNYVFVKYFKESGFSQSEILNHANIANVYNDSYKFSKIVHSNDFCIIQTLIPNKGKQCDVEYMFESALLMHKNTYHLSNKTKALRALSSDVLNRFSEIRDTLNLNAKFEVVLNGLLASDITLDLLYCHGDYTTWNTVINDRGDRYLVDFEECADKVLFTDAFHLLTQKSCLHNEPINLDNLINKISTVLNVSNQKVSLYYVGYILEQLLCDLSEWSSGKRHTQLANLIENKSNLLCETYHRLVNK
jgi:hypothetical protein